MKITTNNKTLTLSITITVFLILTTSLNLFKLKTKSHINTDLLLSLSNKTNNSTDTNTTENNSPDQNTTKIDNAVNGTNAKGDVDKKAVVTKAPFDVKKCDQVVEFEAETLLDQNNFANRTKAFFTLSIYAAIEFKEKKPETLVSYITLAALKSVPSILTGSKNCVSFAGTNKEVVACMKDEKEASDLINAYKRFSECRKGEDLVKIPNREEKIKKMFDKACLGLDISFDEGKFKGDDVKAQAALEASIDNVLSKIANNPKNYQIVNNSTKIDNKGDNLSKTKMNKM